MATFYWEALEDICKREEVRWQDVCSHINDRRGEATLTDALRLFIMSYFRCAAASSEPTERQASGIFYGTPFESENNRLLHERNATTHNAEDEADDTTETSDLMDPAQALTPVTTCTGLTPAYLQAAE